MPKPRQIPDSVRIAKLFGDKDALSRLGRHGAMVKKEIGQERKTRLLLYRLAGAEEMALQANENICPVNE